MKRLADIEDKLHGSHPCYGCMSSGKSWEEEPCKSCTVTGYEEKTK